MAPDVTRVFHEETKNWPEPRFGPHQVEFARQPADNAPITFKEYRGLPSVKLPVDALKRRTGDAVDVLSRASSGVRQLDLASLSRILAFSGGITRIIDRPGLFIRYCRAASSAHSYPDFYLVCGDLGDVEAGVYYFHGLHLRLDRLRRGDFRATLAEMAADPSIARRPATVVMAGVPWRAARRYGERALRHVYWDTGGLIANMVAVAAADDVAARIVLGFVDAELSALIGLDGVNEFPVALVTLGVPGAAAVAPPAIEPLTIDPPALSSGTPLVLPLIVDAQRAGDLGSRPAVEDWRKGRSPVLVGASAAVGERPSGRGRSIEDVILHRGSTRRMLPDALPGAALEWVVATAVQPPPGDWVDGAKPLLEHGLLVHAIDGVAPGVYRLDGTHLRVVREGDVREQGRYVSLKQPQGGDGAYTTFHFADLDRLAATLGPRGYRAAQIEGGYVLERLHLAAFAFGTGATGLTFYDDSVSALFDTPSAVMTEVAVGRPSYQAKRGGLGDETVKIPGDVFDLVAARKKELEKQT